MNTYKNNDDELRITSASACKQGKLYLGLLGHTNVNISNHIGNVERVLQCYVFFRN